MKTESLLKRIKKRRKEEDIEYNNKIFINYFNFFIMFIAFSIVVLSIIYYKDVGHFLDGLVCLFMWN